MKSFITFSAAIIGGLFWLVIIAVFVVLASPFMLFDKIGGRNVG
jgi:hypothetical protein